MGQLWRSGSGDGHQIRGLQVEIPPVYWLMHKTVYCILHTTLERKNAYTKKMYTYLLLRYTLLGWYWAGYWAVAYPFCHKKPFNCLQQRSSRLGHCNDAWLVQRGPTCAKKTSPAEIIFLSSEWSVYSPHQLYLGAQWQWAFCTFLMVLSLTLPLQYVQLLHDLQVLYHREFLHFAINHDTSDTV